MIPTIIVHGGAKTITEDKVAANHAGCTAAEAGWAVLISGGTAKDTVEAAIRVLEADPTFNASLGATLNSDGEVELDAALVEGSLNWGAIAAVQGIGHPISVARKIMDEKPRLLVAQGAERFGYCWRIRTSRILAGYFSHETIESLLSSFIPRCLLTQCGFMREPTTW